MTLVGGHSLHTALTRVDCPRFPRRHTRAKSRTLSRAAQSGAADCAAHHWLAPSRRRAVLAAEAKSATVKDSDNCDLLRALESWPRARSRPVERCGRVFGAMAMGARAGSVPGAPYKSRFRRPEAAQSRRVCKNLFLLEDLVLVVAYLRTTRKGAAVRSAQHRMDRLPRDGCGAQHPSGRGKGGCFIWRPLDGWHLTCSAATSGADHWSPWVRNPWTSAGLVAWHAALRSLSP